MKNNKGLSLVELIVAFAIIAIAGTAVAGLITVGTRHFNSTGKDTGLQYEQQVVVNRLKDSLLEASSAISYNDATKTLLVYSLKDMGTTMSGGVAHTYKYVISKIFLQGTELRYISGEYDVLDASLLPGGDGTLLGENVKDVTFSLADIDKGKINFDITFEKDDKEITSSQVVSLRNAVMSVTASGDVIFVSEEKFLRDVVQYVRIKRGEKVFQHNDEVTEVGLLGNNTITVNFSYEIKANEVSRNYVAYWSLEEPHSTGVSVDSVTGVLTVDPTLLPSSIVTTPYDVKLTCTSMDDISKSQTIIVRIKSDGVYPVSVEIKDGGNLNKVGYRDYYIYPEISYTSGPTKKDGSLCTWNMKLIGEGSETYKLPIGSYFKKDPMDPEKLRYVFRATPQMNDLTFEFVATVKEPKSDSTHVVSSPFRITISGIIDAKEYRQMKLLTQESKYNKRGESSRVEVVWDNNNSVSGLTYYWKLEPVAGSWGNTNVSKFDDRVKIKNFKIKDENNNDIDAYQSADDGFVKSKLSYIDIDADTRLDWKNMYTVKVICYAVDERTGTKYGINDDNGDFMENVQAEVSYNKVRVILKPITVFDNKPFLNEKTIKRAVLNRKTGGNYVIDDYRINDKTGRSVRYFEIDATGVILSEVDVSVNKYETYNTETSGTPTANSDTTKYFGAITAYKNQNVIGFFVDYNNKYSVKNNKNRNVNWDFATFANQFSKNSGTWSKKNKPNYLLISYKATSKHNTGDNQSADIRLLTGDDIYNESDLTPYTSYKYELKYDMNRMQDANFVEIRNP